MAIETFVGFSAHYAGYVHEDLEAAHKVGQAKYLEDPWKSMRPKMVRIIASAMKQGASFQLASLQAGLLLQREAQQLVPVDTGYLKSSAFTFQKEG